MLHNPQKEKKTIRLKGKVYMTKNFNVCFECIVGRWNPTFWFTEALKTNVASTDVFRR